MFELDLLLLFGLEFGLVLHDTGTGSVRVGCHLGVLLLARVGLGDHGDGFGLWLLALVFSHGVVGGGRLAGCSET